MTSFLSILAIWALIDSGGAVSSKIDFGEEQETIVTNSSKVDDDDVEVKHTIVLSTRLKNNNRRGIHSGSDGEAGVLTHKTANKGGPRIDSGEVPVVNGYKAVETTQIRSQDTRNKAHIPESTFISRNIRDEYDVYPNLASNPSQWKPSSYFNNINWWSSDMGREYYNTNRKDYRPLNENPGILHRRITDDGLKEFYCSKCREMNGQKGCGQQQRRNQWIYETTTQKIKIDGKLVKLN